MEHQFNTAEDFLLDDSFVRYRMGVDEAATRYWENWLAGHPGKRPVFEEACRLFDVVSARQGRLDTEVGRFRELLRNHAEQDTVVPSRPGIIRFWRVAAAAVLVLAISAAGWKWLRNSGSPQPGMVATIPEGNDVMPGRPKAHLVMGDGKAVELDETSELGLEEKDGTRIGQSKGQLVYDAVAGPSSETIYNTITTPRGGEYQVVLPDGSKVWMNAGSSLRFPTRFSGPDRTVQLTGEAYFEVAQQAARPFMVQVANGGKIAVLGTSFNIMAYEDERAIHTTLVTGKVKVISPSGKDVLLAPSQQAILSRESGTIKVGEADVDKAIAWKGGMFEFNDDDISTVMRQLARWYDVEVKFSGPVPDKHYTGSFRKQSTLQQALHILKTAGIRFSIEGRQILVDVQQ